MNNMDLQSPAVRLIFFVNKKPVFMAAVILERCSLNVLCEPNRAGNDAY